MWLVNRYYHDTWLNENISRQTPHQDKEISSERSKCLKRYYPNPEERQVVSMEYARFSGALGAFVDPDFLFVIENLWIGSVGRFFMVHQL